MDTYKVITLFVFVVCYVLAISRRFKLGYISMISAAILILTGAMPLETAIFKSIKWDVLGIYWGFMMVSMAFTCSGVPALISQTILRKIKEERYIILALCVITAFLSAFMENVGVVLMMAPIAIELSRLLNSSLFPYMVAIAISSNVVTTVTMVADPPAIILAMESGLRFQDFYWFQGKLGLGTLTVLGVVVALLVLLFQFRNMKKKAELPQEKIATTPWATLLFVSGVIALAIGPNFGISVGVVGLISGLLALLLEWKKAKEMILEFDWNSLFFIVGIFVVIGSLEVTGLLKDFAAMIAGIGITSPTLMLGIIVWFSVAASSFMDNVPYTVLMIPVCQHLASFMGVSPYPFLFGMVVGTGSGGNITPVGAAANVFACGILEKKGCKVRLIDYLKIGVPFTLSAVATIHFLLWLFWLR